MLGPKYTASDVAVLLENGLRDGTIVLSLPEQISQSRTLVGKVHSPKFQRFIPALVSVSVAIIFALVVIPTISIAGSEGAKATSWHKTVDFLTSGVGAFLSVPALLLGYHDVVQKVIEMVKRHVRIEKE
jgi:phosphotransferase system  glucose/maltose/N-acetylglucosamine-specific IIC component